MNESLFEILLRLKGKKILESKVFLGISRKQSTALVYQQNIGSYTYQLLLPFEDNQTHKIFKMWLTIDTQYNVVIEGKEKQLQLFLTALIQKFFLENTGLSEKLKELKSWVKREKKGTELIMLYTLFAKNGSLFPSTIAKQSILTEQDIKSINPKAVFPTLASSENQVFTIEKSGVKEVYKVHNHANGRHLQMQTNFLECLYKETFLETPVRWECVGGYPTEVLKYIDDQKWKMLLFPQLRESFAHQLITAIKRLNVDGYILTDPGFDNIFIDEREKIHILDIDQVIPGPIILQPYFILIRLNFHSIYANVVNPQTVAEVFFNDVLYNSTQEEIETALSWVDQHIPSITSRMKKIIIETMREKNQMTLKQV